MKFNKLYIDFDYKVDFGKLFYIIDLNENGIYKDDTVIFNMASNYKNIKFTGDVFIYNKEINKLIIKFKKNDPIVNIYIETEPFKEFRNRTNIIYNLKIKKGYMYKDDIIEKYIKKDSKFIVDEDYLVDFSGRYFVPKEKIYINLNELNIKKINNCKINNYNFVYDFSALKD